MARSGPPHLRPGVVPRTGLVDALQAERDAAVVLVCAPAGYGKTTLLAEWARTDARPAAWVALERDDREPVHLLLRVTAALADAGVVPSGLPRRLDAPAAEASVDVLPGLADALRAAPPFLLVLDDVDAAPDPVVREVVLGIAEALPPGAQVALGCRRPPGLPLGRLRLDRRLARLGPEELAFDVAETASALAVAGVAAGATGATLVHARTEGWPAGVGLAALWMREEGVGPEALGRFGGDDRLVAEYLAEAVLDGLDPGVRDFLVRASALEVLWAGACDAALGTTGSGELLREIARDNLFLAPADRRGERYRLHPLMGEALRRDLEALGPEVAAGVHRRASAFLAAAGEDGAAIRHAALAGDVDGAAALAWERFPSYQTAGRRGVVELWLHDVGPEAAAHHPLLALTSAWCALPVRVEDALEWLDRAERLPLRGDAGERRRVEAGIALLRAGLCQDGLAGVDRDAARAEALEPADSPLQAVARYLRGTARRLAGDDGEGPRALLEEAAGLAARTLPTVRALALAQLSLVHRDEGRPVRATALARQARALVEGHGAGGYLTMAPVHAVAALSLAESGAYSEARVRVAITRDSLAALAGVPAWACAQTLLLVARAGARAGDPIGARATLAEATRLLTLVPDAPRLAAEAARLQQELGDEEQGPRLAGASQISTAELRVLRLLPTHLTLREIGERLHVSQNTVKTHSASLYRKLGSGSRAEAVSRARAIGLLIGEDGAMNGEAVGPG